LRSHCCEFGFTDFCIMDSFNWTHYICKVGPGVA
jgi:hypothetical protein